MVQRVTNKQKLMEMLGCKQTLTPHTAEKQVDRNESMLQAGDKGQG